MNQIGEKWEEIKQHIKTEYDLSPVSFNTWIQPLKFHDVDHDTVQIVIPSDQAHAVSYISAKYKNYFQVSISEMFNHEYNVSFLLEKDIHNKKENEEENYIYRYDIKLDFKCCDVNGGGYRYRHKKCDYQRKGSGKTINGNDNY